MRVTPKRYGQCCADYMKPSLPCQHSYALTCARAGTLEGEMLGGRERDRRRARLGLSLSGARLTIRHGVAPFPGMG